MMPLSLFLLAALAADPPKDFVGPPKPETTVEAGDPQTIRMRLDQNMRATEDQLRRQKIGEEARKLQEKVIEDIDRLLSLAKQPPPPSDEQPPPQNPPPSNASNNKSKSKSETAPQDGPGGSGEHSDQSGGTNQPHPGGSPGERERQRSERSNPGQAKGGESRRDRRAKAGKSSESMAANAQPGEGKAGASEQRPNEPGTKPGEAPGNPGNNPDKAKGATMPPERSGTPERLSDYSKDVWGHLPETLRQEVDHYYKDKFMPRYRELLQQYYSRLAESERREKERR
ncbi:MAG: hypothetical protein ACJ8C4_19985 [Gemmataceae bacterium]